MGSNRNTGNTAEKYDSDSEIKLRKKAIVYSYIPYSDLLMSVLVLILPIGAESMKRKIR